LQAADDEAGFEHVDPGARRGVGDAGIGREAVQIQQLADAAGG
jgi:hypothetical protein